VKKKVIVAMVSVSSTEAFLMAGLALQLHVLTVAASIPGPKVGEKCKNSDLDGWLGAVLASIQLEAVVAATSKVVQLRETLPTTSRVLNMYKTL
jgi:hypothetical protein